MGLQLVEAELSALGELRAVLFDGLAEVSDGSVASLSVLGALQVEVGHAHGLFTAQHEVLAVNLLSQQVGHCVVEGLWRHQPGVES